MRIPKSALLSVYALKRTLSALICALSICAIELIANVIMIFGTFIISIAHCSIAHKQIPHAHWKVLNSAQVFATTAKYSKMERGAKQSILFN